MRAECTVSQLDTRQTTHKRYSWRSIVLGNRMNGVFYAFSRAKPLSHRMLCDGFVCVCVLLYLSSYWYGPAYLGIVQMRISLHIITIAHLGNNFQKRNT